MKSQTEFRKTCDNFFFIKRYVVEQIWLSMKSPNPTTFWIFIHQSLLKFPNCFIKKKQFRTYIFD